MAEMHTKPKSKIGFLRSNVSALIARLSWATLAGLAFKGSRKYFEVFGYPQILRFSDLYGKYTRQDIASRVVDMPPEEMWSGPPKVTLKGSQNQKAWDAFVKRFMLWDRLIQADKLCAFGQFSLIWIGLPGNQKSPAPEVTSLDDILYLQSYGGENVDISEYEQATSNPRFGQPTIYKVRVGPDTKGKQIDVHFSRIIHIVDRPLQGSMIAEPRLAQVYNTLDDMLKIGGGSAETFWLASNRGMQADVDKEMDLDEDDAAALEDELNEYQHELRRFIRTRGVSIKNLGSDVADPRGVFSVLTSTLAGATSIPQRILFGSEAGQLASEQDRANWATYIERRRRVFAEPYILRPTLQRLEDLGFLKEGSAESATFEWPEAFQTNPIEESNIRNANARSVVNLSRRNQFGDPVISEEEAREMLDLPATPPNDHTMPKTPRQTKQQPQQQPGVQPGAGIPAKSPASGDQPAAIAAEKGNGQEAPR